MIPKRCRGAPRGVIGMCEHCSKYIVRRYPFEITGREETSDIEEVLALVFGDEMEEGDFAAMAAEIIRGRDSIECMYSSDDEYCTTPAVWEVILMDVEGHCCETHMRYDVQVIGDDMENFLLIEKPNPGDTCDCGYSDDPNCQGPPKYARVGGEVIYYCEKHASVLGEPHEPHLGKDAAQISRN